MVRLALPFSVGVALGAWLDLPLGLIVPLVAVVTPLVAFLLVRRHQRGQRWHHGLVLLIWLFCFGLFWNGIRDPRSSPDHVEHLAYREGPWLMRVLAINGTSARTVRVDAEVEARFHNSTGQHQQGTVMLTLLNGADSTSLKPGDRIWVDAPLTPIGRIPDPGGFDRRRWAASRGIHLEAFAADGHWRVVGHSGHWTDPFTGARQAVSLWLDDSGLPQRERALVKALVLGQRDELDGEQRDAFVRSGTIHVLAVSGMHVGLIFAILTFLFGWWGEGGRARFFRGILILLALWCYAGLTGGAPSVLRATIMFSLFTLANMSAQRTDHLNSLFGAAFVLILWDPDMLWRIGFQLSFLAVLGIILFYRPIKGLWSPENKLLRGIWSLAVVSCSAQLLTAPVSLYLFRAFPVWFLPANIIVVTAVGISVYGSVALILLYWVPVLGGFITWSMTLVLKAVGIITDFFASLPGAYPVIRIGALEMILLFTLILSFAAWWQWRWKSMRWVAGCAMLVFLGSWGSRADRASQHSSFVVYDERGTGMAAMTAGRSWVLLGDPDVISTDKRMQRRVGSHRDALGLGEPLFLTEEQLNGTKVNPIGATVAGVARWRSEQFDVLFYRDGMGATEGDLPDQVDIAVLRGLRHIPDDRLDKIIEQARCIVLDAGLPWKLRRLVRERCVERGREVHDVGEQGAFIREHHGR
jgi:competence protein ComEC